jgi:eukaryotic-like serine/threonine-protein kinase
MAMTSRPDGGRSRRWGTTVSSLVSPSPFASDPGRAAGPDDRARDASSVDIVLADFTARWDRGEAPRLEDYLRRIQPGRPAEVVELIYREFCLAEWAGLEPRPEDYRTRFPEQCSALGRLFGVHSALGSSRARRWAGLDAAPTLPEVGDEIGQYRLLSELGRGGFARVFLAEQADLDDRLVVMKVTTRVTPEPQLLARASHPHIVEVLWHGVVEDGALQVICMPFLGGATLSAVLAQRQERGGRPGSGRDLLVDLDRVATAGYLPAGAGRPSHEVIARLSYPRAAAWIVARLAEALDHAYGRGVLHGDVKPSNVLLTADGTPMLLDFNLAVGWRPHAAGPGAKGLTVGDSGGTLAYMAPERLRAVADLREAPRTSTSQRHRADIYALGVILLEMLTGRAPGPPEGRPRSIRELASAYVSSRQRGGEVMIRSTRTSLPASLRAILARCLASDPADRYARASELAEDLDRWRTDRALIHARQPWLSTALARWARRQRLALAAAVIGLTVASVATLAVWRAGQADRRGRARDNYMRVLRDDGAGMFLARQPGTGRIKDQGDPVEIARRHLDRYGVLDPASDWRQRDDFRDLPAFEQAELDAWLLEQALRYAHALGERTDAPRDWRNALFCLERVNTTPPYGPVEAEIRALRQQLAAATPPPAGARPPSAPPRRWAEEYLLGVMAELHNDAPAAAGHYDAVLRERPGSFWGNYRAAAVASARGTAASAVANTAKETAARRAAEARAYRYYGDAARRLAVCVKQSPDNPTLHRLLAGCLYGQGRLLEVAAEYDKALSFGPDQPRTFLLRSIVRLKLGQMSNFESDIQRYEALTSGQGHGSSGSPALSLIPPDRHDGFGGVALGFAQRPAIEPDPDEFVVRRTLASLFSRAKEHAMAIKEYDRALEIAPDDLLARLGRAFERAHLGRYDAEEDSALAVEHPQMESLVRESPAAVYAFPHAVTLLVRQGKTEQAIQTALKGARLADLVKRQQFETRAALARALASAAKADPRFRNQAVEQLRLAHGLDPHQFRPFYLNHGTLDEIRAELGSEPFGAIPAYIDR